jgi:hypothetical protein
MIDWEVLQNEHNIAGDNLKLELLMGLGNGRFGTPSP